MQSITLTSPAKLNLFLEVLNKRPDNYHNIEIVFEKIDLCDIITIKKRRSGIKITCNNPKVPLNKNNLCYKAMSLLKDRFKQIKGAEITIEKNIPVAAGLGGGSSNAASVILGAKKLWGLGLTQKETLELAVKLGADVAFFTKNWSFAKGEGIGEKLTRIKTRKKFWHVLLNPGFGLSTKVVYSLVNPAPADRGANLNRGRVKSSLTKKNTGIKIVICAVKKGDAESLKSSFYNRLQGIVLSNNKAVARRLRQIKDAGEKTACLSGSGPTLFTIHPDKASATRLYTKLTKQNIGHVTMARTR